MKTIDRLILGALAVGIWALIAIQVTSHTPAYAASIAASINAGDIVGLKTFVKDVVVKDCYAAAPALVITCRRG